MLHKGGPKNYDKRDWRLLAAILIGFTVVSLLIGRGSTRTTRPSVHVSAEALAGANKAGYKGEEAMEVAVAADKLCAASGEC